MLKIFLDKRTSSLQIKQTNSRFFFSISKIIYIWLPFLWEAQESEINVLLHLSILENVWKIIHSWKNSKKGVRFIQRYLWMSLASRKMEIITHRTFSRPEGGWGSTSGVLRRHFLRIKIQHWNKCMSSFSYNFVSFWSTL